MGKESVTITPRNLVLPIARFLSEEEQNIYLEAVNGYTNERARETLNIGRKGSSLFKILLLNKIGIRTASLEELGLIAEQHPEFLRGLWEDSPSVVLRSEGDSYIPNDKIAKYLAGKSKLKGFNLNQPVVISGLDLVQNNNAAYGLSLRVRDETEMFEAPELSYENNHKKFSKQDERAMPIFDAQGDRILYTRKSGLSRVFLGDGLGLYSISDRLADYNVNGRVVVVSGEATSPKH